MAKPFALTRRILPESDHNDLSRIDTDAAQNRNPAETDLRPVNGLDTEATEDGDMFLLADSDGRYLDDINAESVIEFLFHKKYQNAHNVFFRLHYDAIIILKLLGDELKSYLEKLTLEFEHDGYRIKYIPNKCLTISKGHHSASFYDVAQFYASSLLTAYEKYIGPTPEWYKELKNKRDSFSRRCYRRNTQLLRKYCIEDCKMAKALGEHWLKLYYDSSGMYPQRLISGAYLVCKAMIKRGLAFPRFNTAPYAAQFLAYQATLGPRIEMCKRGFIGEGWNYDINSAYPDKIAKLPDLEDGEWITGIDYIDPKAKLGFFKIKANIPDSKYVAPFPFRARKMLVFPTGRFLTYATIDELRACESPDYYKILHSWQFIPSGGENYRRPYVQFIEELYARKSALDKDDPLYLPVKIMLNSIYGKGGEIINRRGRAIMGTFFNPAIFAHILGSARAQLYRFIMEKQIERNVVYMHTDSICSNKNLCIDSKELGEFSLKGHADDLFCIQNGINRFGGEWKERGIGDMQGRKIENYKIYEENGKVYMKLRVQRVKNLKSAIRQNKINEIGKFTEETRMLDFIADSKRLWIGKLFSIEEDQFNDSAPLPLNYLGKDAI